MPLTELDFPILQQFLCIVEHRTGMPAQPLDASPAQLQQQQQKQDGDAAPKALPKGVVLGPDGKPCRSCTSVSSWFAMAKEDTKTSNPTTTGTTTTSSNQTATAPPTSYPTDCPPDVDALGRSTWTLLHTLTASYPTTPSITQQVETRQFMHLFSKMYPCWTCADDFRTWIAAGNEPRVSSREDFGRWMCEAHNAVNVKLGKKSFDCNLWEERWRTGWRDGRCG